MHVAPFSPPSLFCTFMSDIQLFLTWFLSSSFFFSLSLPALILQDWINCWFGRGHLLLLFIINHHCYHHNLFIALVEFKWSSFYVRYLHPLSLLWHYTCFSSTLPRPSVVVKWTVCLFSHPSLFLPLSISLPVLLLASLNLTGCNL